MQNLSSGRWLLIGAVSSIFLATPSILRACALDLQETDREASTYQSRGNRCEGVYDQLVTSRINLRIVGFHRDSPLFDPQTDREVRVKVHAYQKGRDLLLKVVSTRRRGFYQMDTTSLHDDGEFIWPLDVVRTLEQPLQPYETAVLACSPECDVGRSARPTLFAVSLSPANEALPVGGTLDVLATADVELTGITVTLRQRDKVLLDESPIGGGFLPPNRPIRIPIEGAEPGEAQLALSATTLQGHRDYLEVVLLIPESDP